MAHISLNLSFIISQLIINMHNNGASLQLTKRPTASRLCFAKILPIDTGSVQFGASLSMISLCVLLLFTFCHHNKTKKLILENASTNCMAASAYEKDDLGSKMSKLRRLMRC